MFEANRKLLALVEGMLDAVEDLTGARDLDWWRLALETGRSTGLYLSAEDFAAQPIRDCAAIMKSAAEMKAEQRADVLKAIRETTAYGPRPGTRAAQVLTALLAANAVDHLSAVSTWRLVEAIGSCANPESLKTVVTKLRCDASTFPGNLGHQPVFLRLGQGRSPGDRVSVELKDKLLPFHGELDRLLAFVHKSEFLKGEALVRSLVA